MMREGGLWGLTYTASAAVVHVGEASYCLKLCKYLIY